MFDNYLWAAADESYYARYYDEEEVEEYEESEDEDLG